VFFAFGGAQSIHGGDRTRAAGRVQKRLVLRRGTGKHTLPLALPMGGTFAIKTFIRRQLIDQLDGEKLFHPGWGRPNSCTDDSHLWPVPGGPKNAAFHSQRHHGGGSA